MVVMPQWVEAGRAHLQIGGSEPMQTDFCRALNAHRLTSERRVIDADGEDPVMGERQRRITDPRLEIDQSRRGLRAPLQCILDVIQRELAIPSQDLVGADFQLNLDADPHTIVDQLRQKMLSGRCLVHIHLDPPSLQAAVRELNAQGHDLPCGALVTDLPSTSTQETIFHMSDVPVITNEVLLFYTADGNKAVAELAAQDFARTLQLAGLDVEFNSWVTLREVRPEVSGGHTIMGSLGLVLPMDPNKMCVNAMSVIVTVARMR